MFSSQNEQDQFQLTSEQEEAIIKAQALIRRKQVMDKFTINELDQTQMESYPTFVVGNDPLMPKTLDQYHVEDEKIALVATSGMRAVSLACKLGTEKHLPKIIIVDNSFEVVQFWKLMREFAVQNTNQHDFLNHLPQFLHQHEDLYRRLPKDAYKADNTATVSYLSQDIPGYFKALFGKYGFDYVRRVMMHASVIQQSWTDVETFAKIKNILAYLEINKVVMYPSNIAECIHDPDLQDRLFQVIDDMNPMLSIHTDCCPGHHKPERVFLIENNQKDYAKQTVFAKSSCPEALNPSHHGISISEDDLLNLLAMYLMRSAGHQSASQQKPANTTQASAFSIHQ
jgi:hypothetical protein